MASCSQPMTCCHHTGRGQGHVAYSNFNKTVGISRKRHKIATWLQRETIRKSNAAYRYPWLTPNPRMTYFGTLRPLFVSLVRVKLETSKWNMAGVTWSPELWQNVAISQKRHNIATCLQWVTIQWSHFVLHMWSIKWWHCPSLWVTLSHISETTKPISFKLGKMLGIRE